MINRFGAGPGKSVIIRHQIKLSKIKQNFPSNSIKLFRTKEFNAVGRRTKANTELHVCVCVCELMSDRKSTTKSNCHG